MTKPYQGKVTVDADHCLTLRKEDGTHFAAITLFADSMGQCESNAAEVARRWNGFTELAEALSGLVLRVDKESGSNANNYREIITAERVLAKHAKKV